MNVIFCEECGGRNTVTADEMVRCREKPPVCSICGNVMSPETIISYDRDGTDLSTQAVDTSRYHLLVIDDDRFYLDVARTILGKEYRISTASSGEEGLRLALEVRPDLILLDVSMEGMDGYETCRKLKKNPELRHIPVLFISAMSEGENEFRGLEVGAVDYIRKPLQLDVLNARIGLQIRLKQLLDKEKEQQEKLKQSLHQFSLHAEQEQEKLARERNNLQTIVHCMKEMVSIQDTEHRIVWANQAALRTFGLSASEVCGKHCYRLFAGRTEVCAQCPLENNEGADVGKPVKIEREDTQAPPFEQVHVPLYDDDGTYTGVAHIVKEVTAWLV